MKNQTIFFKNPVPVAETATIAGPKEGEGPLAKYFHHILDDDLLQQKSHEYAEIVMHSAVIRQLLNRAKLTAGDIDCAFAGDLLDEIISSNFAMREADIPFLGVYNACATLGECFLLGSVFIDGGYAERVVCSVTSHFATAERQFRYPLELGSQRTPLSQWTVTGSAATLLDKNSDSPVKITCATIGKVTDYGINDANDMGGVMVPAALSTLNAHLNDTGRDADYYDLIVTGDLGHAGSRLLEKKAEKIGIKMKNHTDCGILIYNREAQDVNQGGSGACCCGLVFNSYLYKKMRAGEYKRLLFLPTGALLSKTSSLQGETIPAISHAICFEVTE